jgi:hypothetical protein
LSYLLFRNRVDHSRTLGIFTARKWLRGVLRDAKGVPLKSGVSKIMEAVGSLRHGSDPTIAITEPPRAASCTSPARLLAIAKL